MTAAGLGFATVFGACLMFSTVFVLMRILAWVLTEGIPSMISRRSRAVVEWQDCDRKDGDDWDYPEIEAISALIHEAQEPDDPAEHFAQWRAEVTADREIRRYLRRMERWSA